MNRDSEILNGLLLDEQQLLTLAELSRACSMHAEWVISLVDEGILEPLGSGDAAHWRFSCAALPRARAAMRLQRDLGINLAGAALVLDLMEDLENLRARLRIID